MGTKHVKLGTVETIDMETGEVIKREENAMTLLPPAPGTCPECATDHDPTFPHNQQSLYYQMAFHGTHGRWPTWTDAMKHCEPALAADWKRVLIEQLKKGKQPIPDDLKG